MIVGRRGFGTGCFFLILTTLLCKCVSYRQEGKTLFFKKSKRFTVEKLLQPMAPTSNRQDEKTQSNHRASVPVIYTNDPKTVSWWLSENVPRGRTGIVGFDTESLPSFHIVRRNIKRKPFDIAATVQLATLESCLVVHLLHGTSGAHSRDCAKVLNTILRDPNYVKAGFGVDDDMEKLYRIWGGLNARSRLDLGSMVFDHVDRVGLRRLTAETLRLDLPKPKQITRSNWARFPLSDRQITYSARDAWASAAIAEKLSKDAPALYSPQSLSRSLRHELPISDLVKRHRKARGGKA